MKIASIAGVKAHFSNYIKASQEELIVITRNAKPTAVLLPIQDEDENEPCLRSLLREYNQVLKTVIGWST